MPQERRVGAQALQAREVFAATAPNVPRPPVRVMMRAFAAGAGAAVAATFGAVFTLLAGYWLATRVADRVFAKSARAFMGAFRPPNIT